MIKFLLNSAPLIYLLLLMGGIFLISYLKGLFKNPRNGKHIFSCQLILNTVAVIGICKIIEFFSGIGSGYIQGEEVSFYFKELKKFYGVGFSFCLFLFFVGQIRCQKAVHIRWYSYANFLVTPLVSLIIFIWLTQTLGL